MLDLLKQSSAYKSLTDEERGIVDAELSSQVDLSGIESAQVFSSLSDDDKDFVRSQLGLPTTADLTRQKNLEERGDFNRGIRSGLQQTAGLLAGAGGALADAVGFDSLAQKGYDEYQRRMEAAQLNPGQVERVEDIKGFGDAVDWLQYNVGQQVPNMLAMALGGGATGLAGKTVLKQAVGKAVAKKVAGGVAENIAKQQVANRLAQAGVALGSGALEAGGMWGVDVKKHGVEGSSPIQDMGMGLLSGLTEVVSPTGRLSAMAGGAKLFGDVAGKSLLKRIGISIPKSILTEGAQETTQEVISKVNEKLNDPDTPLADKQAISEYLNSFAVGAAIGGVTGPVGAAFEKPLPKADEIQKDLENMAKETENLDPVDAVNRITAVLGEEKKDIEDEAFKAKQSADWNGLTVQSFLENQDLANFVPEAVLSSAKASNKTGQLERNQIKFDREQDKAAFNQAYEQGNTGGPALVQPGMVDRLNEEERVAADEAAKAFEAKAMEYARNANQRGMRRFSQPEKLPVQTPSREQIEYDLYQPEVPDTGSAKAQESQEETAVSLGSDKAATPTKDDQQVRELISAEYVSPKPAETARSYLLRLSHRKDLPATSYAKVEGNPTPTLLRNLAMRKVESPLAPQQKETAEDYLARVKAPTSLDEPAKISFKNREDAELKRQLASDHISTKKSKGEQPRQQLYNIITAADEYLGIGAVLDGLAGGQVFGHPQATSISPEKYGNLIPIRVSNINAVERRIDNAQKLFDELATEIAEETYRAKGGDKKAKAKVKSSNFAEKETILQLLRDETIPELNRLYKQFSAHPTPAPPVSAPPAQAEPQIDTGKVAAGRDEVQQESAGISQEVAPKSRTSEPPKVAPAVTEEKPTPPLESKRTVENSGELIAPTARQESQASPVVQDSEPAPSPGGEDNTTKEEANGQEKGQGRKGLLDERESFTPADLDGVKVKLRGLLPNGKTGTYEESAAKALADIDEEISLYEQIKRCVSA